MPIYVFLNHDDALLLHAIYDARAVTSHAQDGALNDHDALYEVPDA